MTLMRARGTRLSVRVIRDARPVLHIAASWTGHARNTKQYLLMLRRHVQARLRIYSRKLRRFVYHNILHADDPPHRIALGLAIGMFVAMTPTIGAQMVLAGFLCWLFRANKVLGMAIVWLSNPATALPIFYINYVVGNTILRRQWIGQKYWVDLQSPPPGWWETVKFYWREFMVIVQPLWLGSVLLGVLFGYITYYVAYFMVRSYRMRRWGQLVPPSTQDAAGGSEPTGGSDSFGVVAPDDEDAA